MEPKSPLISPFCAKLQSKKAHFLQSPPQTNRDMVDGSNHCWCELTQLALGPDRDLVNPEDCRSDSRRDCFVPYGTPPKPRV